MDLQLDNEQNEAITMNFDNDNKGTDSEKFVFFRDPENPEGDPPTVPTSRIEILHKEVGGSLSLEITVPTIKARILSGRIADRVVGDEPLMTAMMAENGKQLLDVLIGVEAYCKPVVGEGEIAPKFEPENWASETLLCQVFEKVEEYHATFR